MYTFSAECLPLSAPCQASVGRASRRGERKAEDVRQKMYMLIYPDPTAMTFSIMAFDIKINKKGLSA